MYRYKPFVEALTSYVKGLKISEATRALVKLKFTVLAMAWADFDIWDPEVDKEEAMSCAWEDMVIAFSGFGESSSTGILVDFWNSIPESNWIELRRVLNKAKTVCIDETLENKGKFRYLLEYRNRAVNTPKEGFSYPSVVPITGRRTRLWAIQNGLNPDDVEFQLREVAKLESLGLIDVSVSKIAKRQIPKNHLSLVPK